MWRDGNNATDLGRRGGLGLAGLATAHPLVLVGALLHGAATVQHNAACQLLVARLTLGWHDDCRGCKCVC